MYIVYKIGHVLSAAEEALRGRKGFLDAYTPPLTDGFAWKNWVAELDHKTCVSCKEKHGEIYAWDESPTPNPPLHDHCRCEIKPVQALVSGTGSKDGKNGADWWIKHRGTLPDYYLSKGDFESLGWVPGKSPAKYAPDKMMTAGIYQNRNKHLPDAPGRIWQEADLNYYEGRRNKHRLVWSNDGLMFVTYDHYETFHEII